MPDGPRYDDDFYAWTQHQAQVLRGLRTDDNRFDRAHVAEEIEDLGKSERDAVRSQTRRLLAHLLKIAHSPANRPRYGWMRTVHDARGILEDKISPTLRCDLEASLAALYSHARHDAQLSLREFGEEAAAASIPVECPYTVDEILRGGWYPEPRQEQT